MGLCYVIISATLSINIESVSANGVDLSPIPSVGLSVSLSVCVCVSGKCIVAKTADLIRMTFRMVSGVGQGMDVLDGTVIVEGEGAVLGVNFGRPL